MNSEVHYFFSPSLQATLESLGKYLFIVVRFVFNFPTISAFGCLETEGRPIFAAGLVCPLTAGLLYRRLSMSTRTI